MVACMTSLLALDPGDRVLEIGTGSGYQAAVLAEFGARVHSVEVIAELATAAGRRLAELGYTDVRVRCGDGKAGWPEAAPFDGILVTAAAPEILPDLVAQLGDGARLVAPVGASGEVQRLILVERAASGTLTRRDLFGVRFVPLVSA